MGKAPDPLEKTAHLRKNVLSPPPSPGQRKKEERGSESLKERLPETVCSDPSDPSSARFSFPGGKLFSGFGLFSQQRKARPRARGMEGGGDKRPGKDESSGGGDSDETVLFLPDSSCRGAVDDPGPFSGVHPLKEMVAPGIV